MIDTVFTILFYAAFCVIMLILFKCMSDKAYHNGYMDGMKDENDKIFTALRDYDTLVKKIIKEQEDRNKCLNK